MSKTIASLIAVLVVTGSLQAHPVGPPKATADLVLVNAKIWTVDRDRPEAEAVACWRGRILAIGTTAEIRTLVGPQTVVVDCRGRRIVPGFHDSHIHLLGSGLRLSQVALKDAANAAEFGRRIAEFHQKTPRDRWL